jgi:type IV pilus biogenesis protein CpaD/CtpE
MKKLFPIALLLLSFSACSQIPKEAYYNRGAPESLLDASSEVVNVDLRSRSSVDELAQWINRDQPSRAELHCDPEERLCHKAKRVLEQFSVPVTQGNDGDGSSVALLYDRILARDCENRYIDNHINPYELNHPTFGCSVASNIVQMVSDKRQFTSPALMDDASAEKAVQGVEDYRTPSNYSPPRTDSDLQSILQQVEQMSGGGGSR